MKLVFRPLRAGKRLEQQQEVARLRAAGVTVVDASEARSGAQVTMRGLPARDVALPERRIVVDELVPDDDQRTDGTHDGT